ncbi:MAG: hypothetical protein R2749_31950 [Acidimicrobiales bacterium]
MPPNTWKQFWASSTAASPTIAGDAGRLGAVAVVGAERGGGGEHHRLAHLHGQAGVGQHVLDGLERADRPPEGDAILGVLHGHLELGVHGTHRLRRRQQRSQGQLALQLLVDGAGGAQHRTGRYGDAVEADLGEATAQIERVELGDRDAGGVGRHQRLGGAGGGCGR